MHDCGGVFYRDIYEWHSLGICKNGARIKRTIELYEGKYDGERKWQFKVKKVRKKGRGYVELFARREREARGWHLSLTPFWKLLRGDINNGIHKTI